MACRGKGVSPDLWPAQWHHAEPFIAAYPKPRELDVWLKGSLTPHNRSYIWWATARENEGFLMIYHQSQAQLGFWLSPSLRGRGLGKAAFRYAVQQMPRDGNALILATVAKDNMAAQKTALAGGMRVFAAQEERTVFCLYPQQQPPR